MAVGTIAAVITRSSTLLLALTVGFLVLAVLCAVAARPGRVVPPPLQGLDAEQRRLVIEAVNAGRAAPDPALAGAVLAMARRQRTATVLFLLSAALGVYLRIDSLAAGSGSPAFDLALITFWFVTAAAAVRTLVRARRIG